jgi:3-methylcrotonyl-CoA carboxylase beta subunit
MGAEQAANTLADVKVRQRQRAGETLTEEEIEEIRGPVLASFERESNAYYATSQIWDDGIIDPVDTRNTLGIALTVAQNAPIEEPRYGVMRL